MGPIGPLGSYEPHTRGCLLGPPRGFFFLGGSPLGPLDIEPESKTWHPYRFPRVAWVLDPFLTHSLGVRGGSPPKVGGGGKRGSYRAPTARVGGTAFCPTRPCDFPPGPRGCVKKGGGQPPVYTRL